MFTRQLPDPIDSDPQDSRIRGAILSVDIGTLNTRAILFDIVDGTYQFIARGSTPTTMAEPWGNIGVGFRLAVDQITEATGRRFFNSEDELIIPELDDNTGIHTLVVTCSAGKPVTAILVGLVPGLSVSSGKRLAESSYLDLVGIIDLSESRKQDYRVDLLLQNKADIIIVTGGTDGGAEAPVLKNIETIGLACSMMESGEKPLVLYVGNSALQEEATERIQAIGGASVIGADNIRPSSVKENLQDAQSSLAKLFHSQKSQIMPGFAEIGRWTEDGITPTAYGFGQCIRALGALTGQNVLGIDLGSASTTISAVIEGESFISVDQKLGVGLSLSRALDRISLDNLSHWFTFTPENQDVIANVVMNQSAYTHTIPANMTEVEIEYALVREILGCALTDAQSTWELQLGKDRQFLFPTILISGSVLAKPPHMAWSLMAILDVIQPVGISRLLIDPDGAAPSLGILAKKQPAAVVQILEGDVFIDYGYLVSPARESLTPFDILTITLHDADGKPQRIRIPPGEIHKLPFAIGDIQDITITSMLPLPHKGKWRRSHHLRMDGIQQAIICDTRGRPLMTERRKNALQLKRREWLDELFKEVGE